jgi:hypothetical protein
VPIEKGPFIRDEGDADADAFRIVYPPGGRATLFLHGDSLPVIDASERSLHVRLEAGLRLYPDKDGNVTGELRLLHGTKMHVKANIRRMRGEEVLLALDDDSCIPDWAFFDEQRHLHVHFPPWR